VPASPDEVDSARRYLEDYRRASRFSVEWRQRP